ncbi:hypothetical protein [Desulfovibrio sp. An276]|uniref:hypothetical protein n=1 Tax=Desulfovibrio sp. An276 TaxID=1965618 RepID=UPI0013A66BEA|nr:hypothetical protein [Desulfovibrio sp. An276]
MEDSFVPRPRPGLNIAVRACFAASNRKNESLRLCIGPNWLTNTLNNFEKKAKKRFFRKGYKHPFFMPCYIVLLL